MRYRRNILATAVITLLVLLPSSCWAVHRSHHTLPRGSDEGEPHGRDPHSGDPHSGGGPHGTHEVQPAIAPRGKHFSWHSSWQRGKRVTVLAIEPDALRDRRSVLRHNITRHNVRHRHGSNTSSNHNSVHKQQQDSHQEKSPSRPTFPLKSGNTNNKDNEPAVTEIGMKGTPAVVDFNTLHDLRNNVDVDSTESRNRNSHFIADEIPHTRTEKSANEGGIKVLQSDTKPKYRSRKDLKSNRGSRFQLRSSGDGTQKFLSQQNLKLEDESEGIRSFQKSARKKFVENNNTGYHKNLPVYKENENKYGMRENEIRELEGELLEFLERKRRDNGERSEENKNERIRKRRVRRKSRIEKRRQRRRQRNQLRGRRPVNRGGTGEQGDSPIPGREGEGNRRRNGRRRGRGRAPISPAREERKRRRIAERRKRRKERRERRKEKKRGRSLDIPIAGLDQENKSLLNGSNACQFKDLLHCTRQTLVPEAGSRPGDTIPRCKQRKKFLTCMQQQRTNRGGDCSPSTKVIGDLQDLRKYIRKAMFTNSSCIIAESITG